MARHGVPGVPAASWRKRKPLDPEASALPAGYVQPFDSTDVERALEDCRRAWEYAQNPDGILEALLILRRECPCLPKWLYEALTQLLMEGFRGRGSKLRRLWKRHEGDLRDYVRAREVEEGRRLGLTWERASEYAAASLKLTPWGKDSTAGATRGSYKKVARAASSRRYFFGRDARAYLDEIRPDSRAVTDFHLTPGVVSAKRLRSWKRSMRAASRYQGHRYEIGCRRMRSGQWALAAIVWLDNGNPVLLKDRQNRPCRTPEVALSLAQQLAVHWIGAKVGSKLT